MPTRHGWHWPPAGWTVRRAVGCCGRGAAPATAAYSDHPSRHRPSPEPPTRPGVAPAANHPHDDHVAANHPNPHPTPPPERQTRPRGTQADYPEARDATPSPPTSTPTSFFSRHPRPPRSPLYPCPALLRAANREADG